MKEFDDPLTLELRTEREVAMAMHAFGHQAGMLEEFGLVRGAAALSNLQNRLCTGDEQRIIDALSRYEPDAGGVIADAGGDMGPSVASSEAAVSMFAEMDETDPDSIGDGGL